MKHLLVLILIGFSLSSVAQSKKEYVYRYAEIAVREMETNKIPASITLAQGILESRSGQSHLSTTSNNHFGIKCHNRWEGEKTYHDDDRRGECFRKYNSVHESFRDHSEFLTSKRRYASLFRLPIYDYKAWAYGLKNAGYATDPNYPTKLIKIIEEEQLHTFDGLTSENVGHYIAQLKGQDSSIMMASTNTYKPVQQPSSYTSNTQTKPKNEEPVGGPSTIERSTLSREVFASNGIDAVWAHEGDTPNILASKYDVSTKRLKKYNEWPEYLSEFTWGMKVYLKNKKSKSKDKSTLNHRVEPNQTMYQIAQEYGIKTKHLYRLNRMDEDKKEQPAEGEIIMLQKRRKHPPMLRGQEVSQTAKANTIHQVIQGNEKPVETIVIIEEQTEIERESTPNTNPEETSVDQTPSTASETTTNDEYEGRSIIYDPTPAVNQKQVETYYPSEPFSNGQTYPSSNTYSNNPPQMSEPMTHTPTNQITHIVTTGDTLYGLSKKYNVSVAQIKSWNHLSSDTIKLGQKLIVSK